MSERPVHVWFCSADAGFAQAIAGVLGPGFEVQQSQEFNLSNARGLEDWWDVVLLDFCPAGLGTSLDTRLGWMEKIKQVGFPPPIIALLAEDDRALTLRVIENGAYDTVSTPPNMAELRLVLRRAYKFRQAEKELYQLRSQDQVAKGLYDLIGPSEPMQKVFALAQKMAPCDVNVLITGETGTGKELLARAVHRMSSRASRPFVAFSAANLPGTLIEDELFGHEKGAFTGATMARRGRLEVADQGTLFLDEIGDLTLDLQPKLLRVLQERTFERLGSNTPVAINLRLLCATNQDLTELVRQGKFREDLYYRLNVVQIKLPPLRERRDDIAVLAHHFLQQFANQFEKKAKRFSRLALHALEESDWPGNVRELENVVQRAVALADGQTIEVWHLPMTVRNGFEEPRLSEFYEEEVRGFKRRLILRTLRDCGWQKTEAARMLGIARSYLHRLINELQIRPDEAEPAPTAAEVGLDSDERAEWENEKVM